MNAQDSNQFALLWALGYRRLVPIVPPGAPLSEKSSLYKRLHAKNPVDARGKTPGIRWGDGTWSGFDFVAHEAAEDDLHRWSAMGANVGIKTGRGLVLIDADTLNEDHARTILETLRSTMGDLPVRIGRYPKAGYLVRTDDDFQYARIEFGERDDRGRLKDRVEILSEGRQFVAHGIHPDTGKPYRWPKGVPALTDVPFVPAAALAAFLAALRPLLPSASEIRVEGAAGDVDQDTLRGDPALVRRAVETMPNTSDAFPTRESWVAYGYAIRAAMGPDNEAEAFDLFRDWSARWADGENDDDVVAAEWRRMKPPYRRGASWLFELAEAAGGGFSRAEMWFDATAASLAGDTPLFPENLPNAFSADAGAGFSFTPFDEAADTALTTAARPLIKGVLDCGAMSILYGESNAGKTFVAMDVAFHIASGRPWAGKRVFGAPVLYVAAEGGAGARKRAAALKARYGGCDGFHFLLRSVNLLRADADLRPLLGAVAALEARLGVRFGLIVIDTLSRAMAGGDENASTDMGAMVRHLDVLRRATGAHLMAVHHSGKDRAKGARGHSLLRAATDTEIEVADREIMVTKQRDLDGSFARHFDLDVVTLGVDADGDPVTSCTVRLMERGEVDIEAGAMDVARGLVEAGEWRRDIRAGDAWVGVPVAQALRLDLENVADRDRVRQLIGEWVRSGRLVEVSRQDKQRRQRVYVEWSAADNVSETAAIDVFD